MNGKEGRRRAQLTLPDRCHEIPLVQGTGGERVMDISGLHGATGLLVLDGSLANTALCRSAITYIDGEKGILRYRGYAIEDVVQNCDYLETAMLLIWGRLPREAEKEEFSALIQENQILHQDLLYHFKGFPPGAPPIAILSAVISAMSCYHRDLFAITSEDKVHQVAAKLLAKVGTIAAFAHQKSQGNPINYPRSSLSYSETFLRMLFSYPYDEHLPSPEAVRALRLFLVVHADHELNNATTTVRMVGSSGANLFASVAAGVLALWGRGIGGNNLAALQMLQEIAAAGGDVTSFLGRVKAAYPEIPLNGFGHRVYRCPDPRARILREATQALLRSQDRSEPLLDLAGRLERAVLADPFFRERRLFPNVDFYSGILLRAIGIPQEMFQVMFAIGRMPGWIAHWFEQYRRRPPILRPRQLYDGPPPQFILPPDLRG